MSATDEALAAEMTPDADLEPDDASTADEPGDDGTPEAVLPEPVTPEQAEKIFGKLAKEDDRHTSTVLTMAGAMAPDLLPCPCCADGPSPTGFVFRGMPDHVATELVQRVTQVLTGAQPEQFATATDAEPCQACNALGRVLTGSRVAGQETKPCKECTGTGWKNVFQQVPAAPLAPNGAGTGFPVPPNVPGGGIADMYGRPWGHPHYGMNPATVGI